MAFMSRGKRKPKDPKPAPTSAGATKAAKRKTPGASKRRAPPCHVPTRLGVRSAMQKAKAAAGSCARNTARQPKISETTPPTGGPTAWPTPIAEAHAAIAAWPFDGHSATRARCTPGGKVGVGHAADRVVKLIDGQVVTHAPAP